MAYDETLADRIRALLGPETHLTSMKMFGGIGFMDRGNMAIGIIKDDLLVRVGADADDDALAQPGARPMEFGGRTMKGFITVDRSAIADDAVLGAWIDRGLAFTKTLPPKR